MKRFATALAALLLASCGPTLYAEIEIPELVVTLPSQQVPAFDVAIPAGWCDPSGASTQSCVAISTAYDLGAEVPALQKSDVTAELRLTDVALTLAASSGGTLTDLRNVVSVAIRVGATSSSPGVVVASYTRTSTASPPTTLSVSGRSNLDLSPYLASGRLPIRVEVAVDGGTPAFRADITGAFYVKVKLDYGRYLGL